MQIPGIKSMKTKMTNDAEEFVDHFKIDEKNLTTQFMY